MTGVRWINAAAAVAGLFLASMICAPQLLAFPYRADVGTARVYAEVPLDPAEIRAVIDRADALVAASPLYEGPVGTRVFLTDGGWRWRLLALTNGRSLGFTRPASDIVSDAVIIGPSDVARDSVTTPFGTRRLADIIAHERTHIMVRRHLGLIDGLLLPGWISEGYADHVAGSSTLSAVQAARLRREGGQAPALFYFDARRRVADELERNGGNVQLLLRLD